MPLIDVVAIQQTQCVTLLTDEPQGVLTSLWALLVISDQDGTWSEEMSHIWQAQESVKAVACIAEKRGIKPAQVALAWLLSKPALAAAMIGALRPHHIEDAAAAVEVMLTADEIEQLCSYKIMR